MFNADLLDKAVEKKYGDIAVYCNDYTAMAVTKAIPIMELRKSIVSDTLIFMWIDQIVNENKFDSDTKIQVINSILKITNTLTEDDLDELL